MSSVLPASSGSTLTLTCSGFDAWKTSRAGAVDDTGGGSGDVQLRRINQAAMTARRTSPTMRPLFMGAKVAECPPTAQALSPSEPRQIPRCTAMSDRPNLYLLRAADIAARSQTFSHPWNPRSEITGYQMGKSTGLKRTGVNLARLAPGKESFVYHAHWFEEEWIYILQGRGVARIDDTNYDVGPGDFMAFPTPGVAHHL